MVPTLNPGQPYVGQGADRYTGSVIAATHAQKATCRHCGEPIANTVSWGWSDADTPGLVFCTDQDETHDGIRHEPEDEPEPTAAELEADRRTEELERRRAGEL